MAKSKQTPNAEPTPEPKVIVHPTQKAGPNLWIKVYQADLDFLIRVVGEKTSIATEEGWRAALDLLDRLRRPVLEPPFMSQTIAPAPAPDAEPPTKKKSSKSTM